MQLDDIARGFAAWITTRPRGQRVVVTDSNNGHREVWPVSSVAYELSTHTAPLPEDAAVALGLPAGATHAHAARLLWCLREDDRLALGSYHEAAMALFSLHPAAFSACYRAVDDALRSVDAASTWPSELALTSAA